MRQINYRYVDAIANYFVEELLKEIKDLKITLNKIGMDVQKIIPKPFNTQYINTDIYYSINNQSYFINFSLGKGENKIKFQYVTGEPMPIPIFGIGVSSEPRESTLINLTLQNEYNEISIDYSILINQAAFKNRISNIKELAIEIVRNGIDNNKYKEKSEKVEYYGSLVKIANEMKRLISNESTPELNIDKFLENNPIILEKALNLIKFKHQVQLKNVLGKYEHDLKPDLIAFDLNEKNWTIVDYKKAKRTIMKNVGKVRTGLKSEVHDLRYQLRDYIEYFEEKEHRDYVLKNYQIELKHPYGIGIIGNVSDIERDEYNRVMKDEPKWFKVTPYNYLYDNFYRYVVEYSKQIK
ncbi:hypothetical protein JOC25_000021 [Solibacillus kalamii]|uniref:DUF4263 domain-containing protein n=1 Tax=Solibacillus kalamii TaxID=1748298 RepID=A0ABX3ZI45_9BACL|nr:hypothetical protein [Solibacillus kalamii]MBM7663565.1 hypothetical protein [Solibacillus kalamii]OUZ39172.1 hypothetical protein CBM15_09945 [Solibacillus kalamii]